MKIRKPPIFGAFFLQLAGVVVPAPAQHSVASGFECIRNMPIPGYKAILWVSRAEGEAEAKIAIGDAGTPKSIDVQVRSGALVLGPWLKAELQTAVFSPGCAGETLTVRFIYRLTGEPDSEPRNEVKVIGPGAFEVIARPPVSRPQP